MTTKVVLNPAQQIHNISDALQETEYRMEQRGIDVNLLRSWLNQSLLLREMQEQHARGELQPVEYDPSEDY